ncbi:phosphotransferase [Streptomyces sp. NPDC003077]|uniref:phosphotransferase family protein n=1 Tax=Streptomyces sp. NPDC003077 TaxID=3154443 RepID=UPI0033B4A504
MTSQVPAYGGYDQAEMLHILRQACATAGLDSTGAQLLRGHTNAVVRLATSPVVVKIARRGSHPSDVERTVRFVRWLMEQNFPTAPLHPVEQPVLVGQHAVTFWTYLPQPSHPVAAQQLAKPLYALHSLPTPPVALPSLDPVGAIRSSLTKITDLPGPATRFLSQRLDRLVGQLAEVRFPSPETVVQGDPQHRNALHDGHDAVLCDWDTVALGHREWDLVTIEIHCRRFGYSAAHYRAFAETYGYDITRWAGYPVLRDLRELRMITTNARKIRYAPDSRVEVERRIDGLQCEDTQLCWHIL